MTEIAKELLEDITVGEYVRIRYGTDTDQVTVEGVVLKWSENFLSLSKVEGGITKIRLDDNLRALDPVDITESKKGIDSSVKESEKKDGSPILKDSSRSSQKVEYHMLRQVAVLSPEKPFVFNEIENVNEMKNRLKTVSNTVFKNVINGTLDSLLAAIKTHQVEYKYHNLRARVLNAWSLCEETIDYEIFYSVLGILCMIGKDYEYALEPLVRSSRFVLAAYSATMAGIKESAQVFSLCAVLNEESSEINQYFSEMCIAHRDVDTLKVLLERSKNDLETCEKIASCSYMLFQASNGVLDTDITPYFTAYETAKKLLESIPNGWQTSKSAVSYWKEYKSYYFPVHKKDLAIEEEEHIGKIFKFNDSDKWGFITPNHYFYIEQIQDNNDQGILLRKMLFMGLWNNLEVSFELGESPVRAGQTAATTIHLSPKGYEDALSVIANLRTRGNMQRGFVEAFFSNYMRGRIQSGDKKYNFSINSIIDPWLKAYYTECFFPREQDVTFEISGNSAINICWVDQAESDIEPYKNSVKQADIEKWKTYQEKKKLEKILVELPDDDPYSAYPFLALTKTGETATNKASSPLTWGGKSNVRVNEIKASESVSNTKQQREKGQNGAIITGDGKYYAERARRAKNEGRLTEAEKDFENALIRGGFNEAVVCDYISLCMQQEGKIEKAIDLIEKYERQISPEKLLNLKISVYDNKKDYATLCPLYEEAYRTSKSVSKKSHNLFRLIGAQVKLRRYSEALESCRRWESFFNQNRFSTDSDKLKKAAPNIKRQEAICLYHLGEYEEAKKIATDLVRINPADTAAISILDDTLGEKSVSALIEKADDITPLLFDADDDFEDTPEEAGSLISRFVRLLIQQTDIGVNLKSPNIKDGRYIGSTKEGLEDVRKLSNPRRVSLKMRSDTLLAACKLLEQLEQREDNTSMNEYYKYRLAGRAMASWGDFMVSQIGQLDTSRMAYIYALKVLIPTKNGPEQDWINSYNRYIKSFFMAQVGSNSLDDYISKQTNSRSKDGANTDVLIGNRIQDVLLPEFLVGILMLLKAIENQNDRRDSFITDLYVKNTELRNSIDVQLQHFLNEAYSTSNSIEFKEKLLQATEVLYERIDGIHNLVVDVSSVFLSKRLTDDMLKGLDSEKWKQCLTATDFARLNRINYIIRRAQDFYNGSDFESRSDCLRSIMLEVKELLQIIVKEPTDISYDIYLPALEQMEIKITDKQVELYQDFLPKLSWKEAIQPFRTPDGQVQVQLVVENELNYQSADSLTIISVQGPDIAWFNSEAVQSLRGGDEVEIGLLVALKEKVMPGASFSVTIGYSYKCNDSPQNIITKNQDIDFTFIIRNDNFEPLINPFSVYEGKMMDDDSMFVGRSAQIQQIIDMICPNDNGMMNYGRAIAMYGQTRTGKSSLLFHLKKRLEEKYQNSIIIWDVGNIGELPESNDYMANFLYTLLDIGKEALYENETLAEKLEEEGIEPPLKDIRNEPTFAVTLFNAFMKKINAILKQEKKIIVLIIDEFTYLHGYIKEGKITSNFMKFWKALIQNYCIFAIVAGQDDMPEFMREYQNEFACMELLKLTYLEERDAKLLIRQPLERINQRAGLFKNDGSIHKLYTLTAGSAYLTIILCSKLVSFLNEKGAYMVTKGIVNEFLRTRAFGPNGFLTEVHFEAQLQERGHRELDEINHFILLSVARLSQTTGYANIEDIDSDNLSKDEIVTYADRLVDRNVLAKEGQSHYWIQVKLLERFLLK